VFFLLWQQAHTLTSRKTRSGLLRRLTCGCSLWQTACSVIAVLQFPRGHLTALLSMLLVVVAAAVCSQFLVQCGTWQVSAAGSMQQCAKSAHPVSCHSIVCVLVLP
jgi:hypothetical protein